MPECAGTSSDVSGGIWTLNQQGTFHPPDNVNRWLPSMAVNGHGDVAVTYTVAGPSTAPGPACRRTKGAGATPRGKLSLGETTLVPGVAPDRTSRVTEVSIAGVTTGR